MTAVTMVGNTLTTLATLINRDMKNGSKGRSDILANLAGNSAFYAQWVDGIAPVDGHDLLVVAPWNAQAGHTHSGAGDGVPLRGPIASATWGYMPNAAVLYNTAPYTYVTNDVNALYNRCTIVDGLITGIIVPDCPPRGAYYYLDFTVTLIADGAALGHVYVSVDDFGQVASENIVLVANTVKHETLTGIQCTPGRINTIRIRIDGETTTDPRNVYALGWSLNQTSSAP